MITITYVRAKRNAGEKGALPIGELEWLARASARMALIIALDMGTYPVWHAAWPMAFKRDVRAHKDLGG